jgi:hypothetical protein
LGGNAFDFVPDEGTNWDEAVKYLQSMGQNAFIHGDHVHSEFGGGTSTPTQKTPVDISSKLALLRELQEPKAKQIMYDTQLKMLQGLPELMLAGKSARAWHAVSPMINKLYGMQAEADVERQTHEYNKKKMSTMDEVMKDLNPQDLMDSNQYGQLAQLMSADKEMGNKLALLMKLQGDQEARKDRKEQQAFMNESRAQNNALHKLNYDMAKLKYDEMVRTQNTPQQKSLPSEVTNKFVNDYIKLDNPDDRIKFILGNKPVLSTSPKEIQDYFKLEMKNLLG